MGSGRMRVFLLIMVLLAGCGTMDDLNPSGSDKRPPEQPGTTGPAVGQNAPDFTLSDTLGNNVTLSSVILTTQGVVLYFAMEWCPICEGNLDSLRSSVIPAFPNVRFYVIDYTCASVAEAYAWELATGYTGSGFTVLADTQQSVLNLYQATMGSTVVIDKNGVVQMNENYKDGTRLQAILASLP
ncbi:MAG TPA: redoxin domain-containing protein [Nitrospirota bacterium]|nr:redoxin domain-containing protein [Nitrospirota bacterium]